jgi:putative Mg2+ transporter-C (MgtC) family protein
VGIFQAQDRIKGVTTAVSLWITTAIGVTTGVGYISVAVMTGMISLLILRLGRIEHKE